MTKERKIAIEMWQAIREKLSNGELRQSFELTLRKYIWLESRNIHWHASCWFCHYLRQDSDFFKSPAHESRSHKCPLNSQRPSKCEGHCKQYRIADDCLCTREQRLAAVDNIIKALKGEYKEESYK